MQLGTHTPNETVPVRSTRHRVLHQPTSLATNDLKPRLSLQRVGPTRDRVASGRYRPEAPTDPYVLALEHTVLQIMGSLRV